MLSPRRRLHVDDSPIPHGLPHLLISDGDSLQIIGKSDDEKLRHQNLPSNIHFEVNFSPKHRIREMLPQGIDIDEATDALHSWITMVSQNKLYVMSLQAKKLHGAVTRIKSFIREVLAKRQEAMDEILQRWQHVDNEQRRLVNKCSELQQHKLTRVHVRDYVRGFFPYEIKQASVFQVYKLKKKQYLRELRTHRDASTILEAKYCELQKKYYNYEQRFLTKTEEACNLQEEMAYLLKTQREHKSRCPKFVFGVSTVDLPLLRVHAAKVVAIPKKSMAEVETKISDILEAEHDQVGGPISEMAMRVQRTSSESPSFVQNALHRISCTLQYAATPTQSRPPRPHMPSKGSPRDLRSFLSSKTPMNHLDPTISVTSDPKRPKLAQLPHTGMKMKHAVSQSNPTSFPAPVFLSQERVVPAKTRPRKLRPLAVQHPCQHTLNPFGQTSAQAFHRGNVLTSPGLRLSTAQKLAPLPKLVHHAMPRFPAQVHKQG